MDIKEFVTKFASLFDEVDPSEISENTDFKQFAEWSSLSVLSLIAMIKLECGVTLSGLAVNKCATVADVYALINKNS